MNDPSGASTSRPCDDVGDQGRACASGDQRTSPTTCAAVAVNSVSSGSRKLAGRGARSGPGVGCRDGVVEASGSTDGAGAGVGGSGAFVGLGVGGSGRRWPWRGARRRAPAWGWPSPSGSVWGWVWERAVGLAADVGLASARAPGWLAADEGRGEQSLPVCLPTPWSHGLGSALARRRARRGGVRDGDRRLERARAARPRRGLRRTPAGPRRSKDAETPRRGHVRRRDRSGVQIRARQISMPGSGGSSAVRIPSTNARTSSSSSCVPTLSSRRMRPRRPRAPLR